jgi:hypothetical protein
MQALPVTQLRLRIDRKKKRKGKKVRLEMWWSL